jgi:hypothetical protein
MSAEAIQTQAMNEAAERETGRFFLDVAPQKSTMGPSGPPGTGKDKRRCLFAFCSRMTTA